MDARSIGQSHTRTILSRADRRNEPEVYLDELPAAEKLMAENLAVSSTEFDDQVLNSDVPVLVDFWAEWCGPCHTMAPVFARLAGELEPEARFLKLDIEAAPDIATRYNVRSIPMLILFQNGVVVAQRAGAIDERTLRAWLQQHMQAPAAA